MLVSKENRRARPDRHRIDQPRRAGLRHLLPAARQPHHLPRARRSRRRVANLVVAQLLHLESESTSKDISLYINSPGGEMTALFAHPRHDALRGAGRGHDLRRAGRVGGGRAAGRRRQGQALRPAQRAGADPPAPRRGAGPVDRPRAADRRGRRDAPADGRHPRRRHGSDRRADHRRHRPRLHRARRAMRSPTGSSTTSSTGASCRGTDAIAA